MNEGRKGENTVQNAIVRDGAYMRRLKGALYAQYDITALEITPASRGYYGETWKVCADSGCYFLKIDALSFHQTRYRRSLSVIEYLCENGIDDRLCPERLAFYCYHMFFFYLGEFLQVHPMQDKSQRIREYFEDGWILSRIRFADTIA